MAKTKATHAGARTRRSEKAGTKVSRRLTRAPKISQEALESARKFLKSNPIGQRLQAAEFALTLLLKDELPRLRQYIFNAGFDLREISDASEFEQLVSSAANLGEMSQESVSGGYIKVSFEKDQIQVVLFYQRKLTKNQAILFSRSLGEVVAVTYAALGLDMTGLISIDEQIVNK